jgi:hypothetical protein
MLIYTNMKLPNELLYEIHKFLINKPETYISTLLSSNKMFWLTDYYFKDIKILYFVKSIKLLKFFLFYKKNMNGKIFHCAVKNGNLKNIKWLVKNNICCSDTDIQLMFKNAIKSNNLKNIKWLSKNGYKMGSDVFINACDYGNFEIMKWTYKHGEKYDERFAHNPHCSDIKFITKNSNLKVFKWLSKRYIIDEYTILDAAYYGHMDIVKYILNGKLFNQGQAYEEIIGMAIEYGNIKNIKWLKKKGAFMGLYFTPATGNLKMMRWLKKNNCQWGHNDFTYAVRYGNLKNMKWLKKYNCPWDALTFQVAALNGTLKNMKWLKKKGCPWNEETFKYAVINGTLKNMKWLKENNCPWNEKTFKVAVEHGSLNVMKWLKKNGCPWNEQTFIVDCYIGNHKIVKWLTENGCLNKSTCI